MKTSSADPDRFDSLVLLVQGLNRGSPNPVLEGCGPAGFSVPPGRKKKKRFWDASGKHRLTGGTEIPGIVVLRDWIWAPLVPSNQGHTDLYSFNL